MQSEIRISMKGVCVCGHRECMVSQMFGNRFYFPHIFRPRELLVNTHSPHTLTHIHHTVAHIQIHGRVRAQTQTSSIECCALCECRMAIIFDFRSLVVRAHKFLDHFYLHIVYVCVRMRVRVHSIS